MKPSRSKREGRADRAREIQRRRRGSFGARHGPRAALAGPRRTGGSRPEPPRSAACTSPGRGARDRSGFKVAGRGRPGGVPPARPALRRGGRSGEPTARPRSRRRPDRGRDDGPRLPRPPPLLPPLRRGAVGGRSAGRAARRHGESSSPPRPSPVAAGGAPGSPPVPATTRRPGSAGDCREPCRPVLKHGPRSLSGPRVGGPQVEAPRRNESEGRSGPAEAGSGRAAAGAPPPCHEPTAAVAEEERAR